MTRQQAVVVLTGIEGEERLLRSIERGPFALSTEMEARVRSVIERENVRSEYERPRGEILKRQRTRGRQVKYLWER